VSREGVLSLQKVEAEGSEDLPAYLTLPSSPILPSQCLLDSF
jgi:hypothetical protein